MDNLIYEESLNTEVDHSEFISKKWIYVNDMNNGQYTSQVVIDSTAISNSGGYVGWSEGFILMPLVIQLTAATATSLPVGTNAADYSWAIKNGFHQMINSATIEFNNQNIVQQTPFTNVFRSFKLMTSLSEDDVKNHGASIGFYPDNAGSWSYLQHADLTGVNTNILIGRGTASGAAAANACIGIANNQNSPAIAPMAGFNAVGGAASSVVSYQSSPVAGVATLAAAALTWSGASNPTPLGISKYSYNNGMYQRQLNYGFAAEAEAGDAFALNQNSICDRENCNAIYRNSKTATTAGTVSWNIFAKLRLKDLADFFEKVPLLKGSTFRFLINTNQAIVKFNTAPATVAAGLITSAPRLVIESVNVIGGLTCPLMIASNQIGQGGAPLLTNAGAAETYQLSISIFKNQFSAQTSTYTAAQ
jgi:hypothetical protein